MSMLARNMNTGHQHNHQPQSTVKTVVVHKAKVTLGEKLLLRILAVAFVAFSATIISNQYEIYTLNKDLQSLEETVTNQTKVNSDLSMEVSELSKYERILEKASQLGLTLNENNVKVVEN